MMSGRQHHKAALMQAKKVCPVTMQMQHKARTNVFIRHTNSEYAVITCTAKHYLHSIYSKSTASISLPIRKRGKNTIPCWERLTLLKTAENLQMACIMRATGLKDSQFSWAMTVREMWNAG